MPCPDHKDALFPDQPVCTTCYRLLGTPGVDQGELARSPAYVILALTDPALRELYAGRIQRLLMPDRVHTVLSVDTLTVPPELNLSSQRWSLILTDGLFIDAHRTGLEKLVRSQPWALVAVLDPGSAALTAGDERWMAFSWPGDVDQWLSLLGALLVLSHRPRRTWPQSGAKGEVT